MNFFDKKNKILLKELIKTDFKLRYQGSAIGYLWSILKPVLLFLVMYVVFVRFLRFGAGVPHFAVALLLGMTVWNFFSEYCGFFYHHNDNKYYDWHYYHENTGFYLSMAKVFITG